MVSVLDRGRGVCERDSCHFTSMKSFITCIRVCAGERRVSRKKEKKNLERSMEAKVKAIDRRQKKKKKIGGLLMIHFKQQKQLSRLICFIRMTMTQSSHYFSF